MRLVVTMESSCVFMDHFLVLQDPHMILFDPHDSFQIKALSSLTSTSKTRRLRHREVKLGALALKSGLMTPGPGYVPLYYTYLLQTLILPLRKLGRNKAKQCASNLVVSQEPYPDRRASLPTYNPARAP